MSNFRRDMLKLAASIETALESGLEEFSEDVATDAKRRTPHGASSGLAGTIKVEKIDRWSRSVVAGAPFAGYVEFGNDPGGGWIYPTHGKVLKFTVGGVTHFATKVRAHGPLPFMEPAGEEAERRALSFFTSRLFRVLK